MSTRLLLAAAGLALAMIVTGAAPAAAQDAPPAEQPPAKKKVDKPRGAAAEASRAATESTPAGEAESLAPEDAVARPAPATAPRAPSAIPASPPRPLGQTSGVGRVGRVTLPTRLDPKTGQQVVVIGNSDLERLYGTSVVPVSSSAGPAAPGAASAMRDDSAAIDFEDEEAGGTGGNGAARVTEIDAELKRLNDNARSISNPFLPPPRMTDAEKAAVEGKDNKERLDMTRQRIQELQQEKARLESSPSGAGSSGR